MKELNKNIKGGWFEEADPACLNEKGKTVARRHHEVSIKEKLRGVLRIPLTAPLKPDDKDEDEDLAEEIVEEVQESHKESATAKISDKGDPEDLADLVEYPNESDPEGIDTSQPEIDLVKSGDSKSTLKIEDPEKYT